MALAVPETGAVEGVQVAEAVEDLARAHRPCSGGGDLERQRDTVERSAQIGHEVEMVGAEVRAGVARPLAEQPHRRRSFFGKPGPRRRQRPEGHHRLTGEVERGPARRQHGRRLTRGEERLDGVGGALDHVLAVVGEQQGRVLGGRRQQGGERRERQLGGDRGADRLV